MDNVDTLYSVDTVDNIDTEDTVATDYRLQIDIVDILILDTAWTLYTVNM